MSVFPDRPMTPKQIADYLQVSLSTVARQVRLGKVPFMKVGHQVRFLARDVITALKPKEK